MLVAMECIAKGESPLLARERLDSKLLTGLAEESSVSGQQFTIEGPIPTGASVKGKSKPKSKPSSVQKPAAAPTPTSSILILALIISMIINLLLTIHAIWG